MFHKRNLLFIGISLLAVFSIAVWLVGQEINTTAKSMHNAMLREIGNYRSDLLALDFEKTVNISEHIRNSIEKKNLSDKE